MPRATIYHSESRGPLVIREMTYQPLKNAAEKLRRMGDPSRAAELEAMDERLAELKVEYKSALDAEYPDATPERQAAIVQELKRLIG